MLVESVYSMSMVQPHCLQSDRALPSPQARVCAISPSWQRANVASLFILYQRLAAAAVYNVVTNTSDVFTAS